MGSKESFYGRLVPPFRLFVPMVLLGAVGLVTLSSISSTSLVLKQLFWHLLGLAAYFAMLVIPSNAWRRLTFPLYIASFLLLVAVDVAGVTTLGAQRRISLGFLQIQPSEFAKISLVLAVAWVVEKERHPYNLLTLFKPLGVLAPLFILTAGQPDLGTALVMMGITGSMVLHRSVRPRTALTLLTLFVLCIPVIWNSNLVLKEYQKDRIRAVLNPERDPLNKGYHIIQSKIAIGSGRLVGKGYGQGSQSRLNFLPEKCTDFIFAVFAEEWGFVGSALLLLLYALFIWQAYSVARYARDSFSCLVGVGLATMLLLHFFINVGMTMGLLPVVGVPLPLVSYGGSSLVVTYAAVGILSNIWKEKGPL